MCLIKHAGQMITSRLTDEFLLCSQQRFLDSNPTVKSNGCVNQLIRSPFLSSLPLLLLCGCNNQVLQVSTSYEAAGESIAGLSEGVPGLYILASASLALCHSGFAPWTGTIQWNGHLPRRELNKNNANKGQN